jgi:hypothetical protein
MLAGVMHCCRCKSGLSLPHLAVLRLLTWPPLRCAVLVCPQDRKNRELGAENGKLQRAVLNLTEHKRQLDEVSVVDTLALNWAVCCTVGVACVSAQPSLLPASARVPGCLRCALCSVGSWG